MRVILDACAVIAFFKGEVGANVVEEYLFNSIYDCVIHCLNLCEVYYDFLRSEGESVAENVVRDLEMANVSFSTELSRDFWRQVSKYKATIKRISLADCFALALANQEDGILVSRRKRRALPVPR